MFKTIIGLLVVGAVAVGGYFIMKSDTKVVDDVQKEETETPVQSEGKKMAFSELVKQNGTYKCEVKQAMSDFENSGTVYMSGTNMRGEFNTVAEGRTVQNYFVIKDGYMYNWSSFASEMGAKIKVEAIAKAREEGAYAWSPDQVGDYNCEAWTPEASKFEIPAQVNFTTF
jgi:hypothetical protein